MNIGFAILTEAPIGFLFLCLLAGVVISMLLYFRNRDTGLPPRVNLLLSIIRFLAISIIAFLLLNPLVKRFAREKELPVVVIAIDNSESMLLHSSDTTSDAALLRDAVTYLTNELSSSFYLETLSFGEAIRDSLNLDFSEKETDISSVFTNLENRYAGRNRGAYIIISDGIYNRGFNPVSFTERLNNPVYTVAWGDTTIKRDLILAEVNYNRIAYLGNSFPLEIVIKATRCSGLSSRLIVRNSEKVFHSQPFEITGENFSKIVKVDLNADKEGIMGYEVLLEPVSDEITLTNNRTRVFVEVLTGRKKILILSSKPHPDLGAMYNALQFNDMLETEVVMIQDYKGQPGSNDLIIMHQLPDDQRSADLFTRIMKERIPVMVIGGGNTRHEFISGVGAGPAMVQGRVRGQHNEVLPSLNTGFALFTPVEEFTRQLNDMPPLYVPFGKYDPNPGAQSMIFQRIGNVTTNYPLISFSQMQGNRACFIAGEGIWKWRIFSYRNTKSHKPFDSFFNQFVQYLTAGEDKSRFRVSTKSYFSENENISFTAELYDAAYNPVTEPEISLNIVSGDEKSYQFTFSRKESFYTLEAGRLPAGEYRYSAKTLLGDERFTASGRFVIAPVNIESTITRADHAMLRTLSHNTGGRSVHISGLDDIIEEIKNRDDIKPVSHLREKFTDLTTVYWLLGFILILLAIEWFFRKWYGGY